MAIGAGDWEVARPLTYWDLGVVAPGFAVTGALAGDTADGAFATLETNALKFAFCDGVAMAAGLLLPIELTALAMGAVIALMPAARFFFVGTPEGIVPVLNSDVAMMIV